MRFLSAIVLGFGAVSIASAQGAPPDVPRDHWAFKAVDNLYRAGVLVGYPDGKFHGSRPVTRYELAAAANAFRVKLAQAYRTEVSIQLPSANQLGQELNSLTQEMEKLKAQRADIDALGDVFAELRREALSIKNDLRDIKLGSRPR